MAHTRRSEGATTAGMVAHTYAWDAEGRLKSVDNGATASFTYNALGQRAVKALTSENIDALYDPFGNTMAYLNISTVFQAL